MPKGVTPSELFKHLQQTNFNQTRMSTKSFLDLKAIGSLDLRAREARKRKA